jgi:hypothetical protein
LKVRFTPIAKGGHHNFSGLLVGNQLRFLGMSPLLAAVMPILVFPWHCPRTRVFRGASGRYGGSIGCSKHRAEYQSARLILRVRETADLPDKFKNIYYASWTVAINRAILQTRAQRLF